MSHCTVLRANIRLRLCIALIAVLALGAFAVACGGESDDTSSRDETPTRAVSSSTAASTRTPVASATAAASPTAAALDATATSPAPAPTQPGLAPTPVPTRPPAPPPPPPPPPPPAGVSITIAAFDALNFSPRTATAPAGSSVTLTFDNQDAGVLHDLRVFSSGGALLAQTDIFEGVGQRTVTFTVGAAGAYPFTCSVHPQNMRGTLTVQ